MDGYEFDLMIDPALDFGHYKRGIWKNIYFYINKYKKTYSYVKYFFTQDNNMLFFMSEIVNS